MASKFDELAGRATADWEKLPNGNLKLFQTFGFGVVPVIPGYVATALRWAETEDQLRSHRSSRTRLPQVQLGLTAEQARALAKRLLAAADEIDPPKGTPYDA
jgi:hypothetical protein